MIIDVHAHIVDASYLEELKTLLGLSVTHENEGAVFLKHKGTTVAWYRDSFFSVDERLKVMDAQGVDMRLLSLSSPSVYDWDEPNQIRMARHINDGIAKACRAHPDRFRGLATLPMANIEACVQELDRVMADPLFVGIAIGSHIAGMPLNDPKLDPFWQIVSERGLPVVEHPMAPLGADHMNEFELPIRVGFVYETTTAATRMIYGGVFERYPNIKLVLPHTGGTLLPLLQRLDNGYRIFPDCRKHITKLPSEYAKNLYYDTCSFYTPMLEMARSIVGTGQLLFGSDEPFICADTSHVTKLDWPDEDIRNILGENARNLFKIK